MNRSRTWIFYAGGLLLAGLLVLAAWVGRDRLSPAVVGGQAPDFLAYNLQGMPVSLGTYQGKVVLLNLWATWCAPCKKEMPSLQRLYEEIQNEDFRVLAVSIDPAAGNQSRANPLGGKLRAFADSLGLTFTLLHDPSGKVSTTYRPTGVPESFVIDRGGVIVRKITGPMDWDVPPNVELIRRLLSGGGPGTQ
jgi:cytochrome c biogenesis protein CcmG/thiol:disulfide interchange protein DsbE